MHSTFAIPQGRDKEQEANDFASEFLMPEKAIRKSLEGLKLSHLSTLKNYWLTSKSSIVRRAYSLGSIDKEKYKYFNIELSRSGEKKQEKEIVDIDMPFVFNEAVKIHTGELEYTKEEIAKAFSLPLDVIQKYLFQQPFAVVKPKIRVIE